MRKKLMLGLLGGLATGYANAATFSVNSLADSVDAAPGDGVCASAAGVCGLRAAVQEANALQGADIISLPPGIYTLTLVGTSENLGASGDLDISDDLAINGTDPSTTIISAGGGNGMLDRVMQILGAHDAQGVMRPMKVTLRGLTIADGYKFFNGSGGGGICNHCDDKNVVDSASLPTLHLINTVVTNNYDCMGGGGISNFGTLIIDDSRIEGNFGPYGFGGQMGLGGGMGGGILNWGGTVSINRSKISNNVAQSGGAIYNQDTMVPGVVLLADTTISGNKAAMGGGIYNVASGDYNFPARVLAVPGVTINRSTIANNSADLHGGGLYNIGTGTVAVLNSTVSNNVAGTSFFTASSQGGGIYSGGRLLDISSSTISGNESSAARISDALTTESRGGDEIFFNTTDANSDPATSLSARVKIKNSIIGDGASTDDNCNGGGGYAALITSGENNLDSGSSCAFALSNDRSNANPLLDALANNGGLTQTRALFSGSPAINAGSACPSIDQRSFRRDAQCDAGALESGAGGNAAPAPVNTAPLARNGVVSVAAGAMAGGTLVAVDGDRDPISYQLVANAAQGTVTITDAATGAFSYTAQANAIGTDSFTFKANDGRADSNVATIEVRITSLAANIPPVAQGLSLSVAPGAQFFGKLFANDQNTLDVLQYSVVANPTQGAVTISNAETGAFSYTANPGATGVDSFTFKANDGRADSNIATVTIAMVSANVPPVSTPGILSVAPGGSVTSLLRGTDADTRDVLTFSIVSQGTKGTATITNPTTGAVVFTAAAIASGTDTFSFKVNDGTVDSAAAAITVTFAAANTAPIANNGVLNLAPGATTQGTLVARDGNPADVLTYTLVSNGTKGNATLTNAATGAFSYSANANVLGTDTFTFKANDGRADSNVAIFTVNIAIANTAPIASPGILTAIVGRVASGTLGTNDPNREPTTFALINPASQGIVTLLDETTGAFTYVPNERAKGTDSFGFAASRGANVKSVATVMISIAPPPSVVQPLEAKDWALDVEGSTSGKLSAKGLNGAETFVIVDQAAQGVVTLDPLTGAFTYTANPDAKGVDRFTYKIRTASSESNLGTVVLTFKTANAAGAAPAPPGVAESGGGGTSDTLVLMLLLSLWSRKRWLGGLVRRIAIRW